MKVILIASILPSSETWNSVIHEVIIPLIPPWPSSRRQPEIFKTSLPHPPLGVLKTSPHAPCTHIPRGPRVARSPRKASEREKDAALLKIKWANVNVFNIASLARKNLSRLTCFNSDITRQLSQAKEGQRRLRKRVIVLTTSALMD